MPTKPRVKNLNATSAEILNAIRNNATENYRDMVPEANITNLDSLKEIGNVLMEYPGLKNQFLEALLTRIARVWVTSKVFSSPLAMFKKGLIELGETIEEIFVGIAKPFQYDPEQAEKTVFKREKPDVRSAFHTMNFQVYYKTTIQNTDLKTAFLSWDGVTDLIAKITEQLYTAANYDDFQVMKYLIALNLMRGRIWPITVPTISAENMKTIAAQLKGVSNQFEFMNNKYNIAGVRNYTNKSKQYLLINATFDATMDVEVLASAFNMNKAEFLGHRVLIDGFGSLDLERLTELFGNNPEYHEFSQDELNALDMIPAVLIDEDWFMVFDNWNEFTEIYNAEGLYWNYFYHVWKTYSISPFNQAVSFVPGTPKVSEITVSPSTATATESQMIPFTANVMTEYFAPQSVNWTVDSEFATVNIHGEVTLKTGASGDIVVTATSTFDPTVSATATITVA